MKSTVARLLKILMKVPGEDAIEATTESLPPALSKPEHRAGA
jgi:hypothetical protein